MPATTRLAVLVAALCGTMLSSGSFAIAGVPHPGETAPAFSLPKAAGRGNITLASLKGKPVYLNFFATWCVPCNEEAPSVVELYKKYHGRGLVTLGVNELENRKKALEFAKKFSLPFDVVVDDGPMGKNYGVLGMPVHVFIDRLGKISTYRLGQMNPGEIESAIKKIL
jgi:cytochrome c biogenesis protein CcmG/thiol:disulfide interchange protein DsbE